MSTSVLALEERSPVAPRSALAARALDYLELTKPRIAVLELVTVAAAAAMAGWQTWPLVHVLVGTALVAASASALNQWWERTIDGRMDRTADRPLPAGRLTGGEVLVFGGLTAVAGAAYLLWFVNPLTALLGVASWVLYVLIYTPLKTRTPANTFVGAIAGALPILMGWSAMGASLGLKALSLFLVVFLWQFPHFMAIAWLYRHDYAAAGMKMLPVVEPSGLRAGMQAALAALVLLPVSFVPGVLPMEGNWLPEQVYVYFVWASLLGAGQLACAVSFLARRDRGSARRLLRASLVYLPCLLAALVYVLTAVPA